MVYFVQISQTNSCRFFCLLSPFKHHYACVNKIGTRARVPTSSVSLSFLRQKNNGCQNKKPHSETIVPRHGLSIIFHLFAGDFLYSNPIRARISLISSILSSETLFALFNSFITRFVFPSHTTFTARTSQ